MRTSFLMTLVVIVALSGCVFSRSGDDKLSLIGAPVSEAAWIRDGEPIKLEGENWYPTDEVENLLDNEVVQIGTYRDVLFYLDRTDVKPFDRVYTRFTKNRYRAFEKKQQ